MTAKKQFRVTCRIVEVDDDEDAVLVSNYNTFICEPASFNDQDGFIVEFEERRVFITNEDLEYIREI